MAVASAIVVYAFVTGLIGGLSSSAGSNLVTATASLVIPSGSGAGLLVISIQNSASDPVTGIQVTYTSFQDTNIAGVKCIGETPAGGPCNALAGPNAGCGAVNAVATGSIPFCNAAGAAILTGSPLQVGGQTGASENVVLAGGGNLQTGTSYSMTVTVDFANGGTSSQAISVIAQL